MKFTLLPAKSSIVAPAHTEEGKMYVVVSWGASSPQYSGCVAMRSCDHLIVFDKANNKPKVFTNLEYEAMANMRLYLLPVCSTLVITQN